MANVRYRIHGIEAVQKELTRKIRAINGGTLDGVTSAAKLVESESKQLTSIDTRELIESTFVRTGMTAKNKPIAVVGYEAKYAAAVHEMPADTNWKKPGAENKFLQKAVVRNFAKILSIIKSKIKL